MFSVCEEIETRYHSNKIIAIKTEAEIGITKNRLTKVDHTDEKHSQEVWRNRARKTETHFSGKYLKGVPSVAIKELVIYPEDDKDIAQCAYCGHGMLDETTSWVQCDKCLRWIHQECDITNPSETNYIYKECLTYLERLQMTSVERENLEISTRTQRSSSIWWNERKIRVTTSFFGTATAHGTKCEKLAIEAYVQKTNALCHPAGLFVHRDYAFLAGSPDGLLENDGLLEIKSPYSARHCDPNIYKLDY
ncbi:YqaJ-like viral recombinase domain [Popillia japonica]|uniref:YqaJ-like viral recombinase domain n=1 Tax=Popillia japonica TaxID=7064 RepID=A0AAW1HFQ8_POPJA